MRIVKFAIAPSALAAMLLVSTVLGAPPDIDRNLPGLVEGYVVDLNGNSVAGAHVQILAARSGAMITDFQTGRAGTFQVRLWAGDYEARAGKEIFPSAVKQFSIGEGQTLRLRLTLRERPVSHTGVLACSVQDALGGSIANAWARVYSIETGDAVARFSTDELGSSKLALNTGKYYLESGSSEFETAWREFEINPGVVSDLKVVLMERSTAVTGALAGFVCNVYGDKVPGVTAFIYSNETGNVVSRVVTDESGWFRLDLKPGKYTLKTISAEYLGSGAEFEVFAGRLTELRFVLVSRP